MINKLAQEIHENAKSKGFYDGEKNIGEMLALIHSEVSEALEADRKDRYCNVSIYTLNQIIDSDNFPEYYEHAVKGRFEEEMADIVIRVMDLCAFKNIDLENHIKAKMKINSLREYKHGKKY